MLLVLSGKECVRENTTTEYFEGTVKVFCDYK